MLNLELLENFVITVIAGTASIILVSGAGKANKKLKKWYKRQIKNEYNRLFS